MKGRSGLEFYKNVNVGRLKIHWKTEFQVYKVQKYNSIFPLSFHIHSTSIWGTSTEMFVSFSDSANFFSFLNMFGWQIKIYFCVQHVLVVLWFLSSQVTSPFIIYTVIKKIKIKKWYPRH